MTTTCASKAFTVEQLDSLRRISAADKAYAWVVSCIDDDSECHNPNIPESYNPKNPLLGAVVVETDNDSFVFDTELLFDIFPSSAVSIMTFLTVLGLDVFFKPTPSDEWQLFDPLDPAPVHDAKPLDINLSKLDEERLAIPTVHELMRRKLDCPEDP